MRQMKTVNCSRKSVVILISVILSVTLFVFGIFAAGDWFTDKEPVEDYAFSFALVGDTQVITLKHPNKLSKIYDWLIANKESKKIAHVFGLGDITNDSTDTEWQTAAQQIARLDGVIPYSLIRGNHDKAPQFEKFCCTETYLAQFDGFYRNAYTNSYRLFSVCDVDFLFITLDFGASDRILKWAAELIETYPDRKVIITTHAYLHKDGTTLDHNDGPAPTDEEDGQGIVNNGDDMWDRLISKYENIFLVVSGHVGSDDVIITQTPGVNGNIVTQMLVDSQTLDKSTPSGMVVMLYFSNDGTTVSVEQYSTIQAKYYRRESQVDITVPAFFSKEETTVEETSAEETLEDTDPIETEEITTEAETTAAPVSESKDATGEAEGGCASTVGGSALVASLLPLLFAAFLKKRDDER